MLRAAKPSIVITPAIAESIVTFSIVASPLVSGSVFGVVAATVVTQLVAATKDCLYVIKRTLPGR